MVRVEARTLEDWAGHDDVFIEDHKSLVAIRQLLESTSMYAQLLHPDNNPYPKPFGLMFSQYDWFELQARHDQPFDLAKWQDQIRLLTRCTLQAMAKASSLRHLAVDDRLFVEHCDILLMIESRLETTMFPYLQELHTGREDDPRTDRDAQ